MTGQTLTEMDTQMDMDTVMEMVMVMVMEMVMAMVMATDHPSVIATTDTGNQQHVLFICTGNVLIQAILL